MQHEHSPPPAHSQSGNALFLILIAVALFAALAYAITSSSRGGGSIEKETAVLEAARITQFGAAVRSAATRMILTGTTDTDLAFCTAAPLGACFAPDTTALCSSGEDCVFAPEGGGVIGGTMPRPNNAEWAFFSLGGIISAEIDGIGQTGCGDDCHDIFAMLQISETLCNQINKSLGLGSPPAVDADGVSNSLDPYPGEPFFCAELSGGFYSYVHTIVER